MNKVYVWLVNYSIQQMAIFALVISLIYYFMFFDDGALISNEIAAAEAELSRELTKKTETESLLKEEDRMKMTIGKLSQQYVEISKKIPTSLPSIDLNRSIDALAKQAKVSVKARKPMQLVESEIVDEIPVEVSLEGSYSQIAQFIYLISISERVATFKNYRLAPIGQKSTRLKFDSVVVGYQLSKDKKNTGGKN